MPTLNLLARSSPCALLLTTLAGCKPFGDLGEVTDTVTTTATSDTAASESGSGSGETSATGVGPPGPPDEWDEELAPTAGSRLRPIFRVADDGASFHVAWYDTQLDITCTFLPTGDGVHRCYPVDQASMSDFADPDCTVPLVRLDSDVVGTPKLVQVEVPTCELAELYEVTPYDGVHWTSAGGDCIEIGADPGFFTVTALAPSAFVAATVSPALGNSRIVPQILDAEDGSRAITSAWDRSFAQEVEAQPGDADLRWFGRAEPISVNLFGDAGCTDPIAAGSSCAPPGLAPATAQRLAGGCNLPLIERRRVVGAFNGGAAFRPFNDVCQDIPASEFEPLWALEDDALTDQDFGLVTVAEVAAPRLTHLLHGNPEGEPFLASGEFRDAELDDVCRFERIGEGLYCLPPRWVSADNNYLDAACTQQVAWQSFFDCPPDELPKWAVDYAEPPTVHPILEMTPSWGDFRRVGADCVPDTEGPPDGAPLLFFKIGPAAAGPATAVDVVQ